MNAVLLAILFQISTFEYEAFNKKYYNIYIYIMQAIDSY